MGADEEVKTESNQSLRDKRRAEAKTRLGLGENTLASSRRNKASIVNRSTAKLEVIKEAEKLSMPKASVSKDTTAIAQTVPPLKTDIISEIKSPKILEMKLEPIAEVTSSRGTFTAATVQQKASEPPKLAASKTFHSKRPSQS